MKLGLLICSFNRPSYLSQCLASVKAADLSQVSTVLVVDDASTDLETRRLIDDFELPGVELIKAFSKENRSIKGSLLFGLDILFNTCDVVTNLDGDAIVAVDAFSRLIELRDKYPGYILSGFNCSTKNKDGSVRHKILEQGDTWNKKYSVGGISMMFDHMEYLQIIKPALQKCLKSSGNWDHSACIISNEGYGKPIVVVQPSVVQHIGVETSSMGHMAGGEPPDVSEDFGVYSVIGVDRYWKKNGKLSLPEVTLIAVDDNIDAIIKAADISCRGIEFGAVKLLSSKDSDDPRAVKIRHLGSKEAYSRFCLSDIVDYIDTPFFITIQADGWICDGTKFNTDWFNFDFIGARWAFRDYKNIGNGACSFRSKRLHQILKDDPKIIPANDEHIKEFQEDHNIGFIYREYLEATYGIKFATEEVADSFSIEAWGRKDKMYCGQFGFHGKNIDWRNAPFFIDVQNQTQINH